MVGAALASEGGWDDAGVTTILSGAEGGYGLCLAVAAACIPTLSQARGAADPGVDVDLSTNTDAEDLGALGADLLEFVEGDVSCLADLVLEVCAWGGLGLL
jgi:hypothetical protein